MVHKKSEYRLNYRWIAPDLSKSAWETGRTYRVQRRKYDLSHLPLPWEGYGCDCDEFQDESDRVLPLPRSRLKHQVLTEGRRRPDFIGINGCEQNAEEWYRQWEETEHRLPPHVRPQKMVERGKEAKLPYCGGTADQYNYGSEERQRGINEFSARDDRHVQYEPRPQAVDQREDIDIRSREQEEAERRMIQAEQDILRKREEEQEIQRQQQELQLQETALVGTSVPLYSRGMQTEPMYMAPKSPRFRSMDIVPTPASNRPPSYRQQSTAPRFMSYGWANAEKNVADKRTFNVYAPTSDLGQFEPSAVRAWKRKEIDNVGQSDADRRLTQRIRELNRPGTPHPAVSPTSVWLSEYQRQYGVERCCGYPQVAYRSNYRPLSAPPARLRPVGSIFHHCGL